ncbi:MAG: hypothetical protein JNL83_11945 [Myxococcales bacterium]|nr:hypothetical protein [Myxococcales bacterium]
MRHAWLWLALVACKQGTGDDYPINPGGDDTGDFHPMNDAPLADQSLTDSGGMITGRVCLLADVRVPASCAATGAGNIAVTLGAAGAMTADDGMFSLVSPGGTGLVWSIGRADLVPSVVPVTTSNILPIMTSVDYDDMLTTNGVILNAGEGALVVHVRDAAGPLAGAGVTVTPSATYPAMHDTATKTVWVAGNTGPLGVSWTPGISSLQSTASVTVTPPTGAAQQLVLPIRDGAITFASVAF